MLNRRDFLKLAALSTSALAFRPFQAFALPDFPQADRRGRIAVGKMDVFAAPDGSSPPIAALYEDQVIPWVREVVGSMPGRTNQRFIETPMVMSGAAMSNPYGINPMLQLRVFRQPAWVQACGSK